LIALDVGLFTLERDHRHRVEHRLLLRLQRAAELAELLDERPAFGLAGDLLLLGHLYLLYRRTTGRDRERGWWLRSRHRVISLTVRSPVVCHPGDRGRNHPLSRPL